MRYLDHLPDPFADNARNAVLGMQTIVAKHMRKKLAQQVPVMRRAMRLHQVLDQDRARYLDRRMQPARLVAQELRIDVHSMQTDRHRREYAFSANGEQLSR